MTESWIQKNRSHCIVVFLILVGTFTVYAPALHGQFLINWDDSFYVVENPAVRGFTLEHIKEAFTNFYVGNYAPVQIVSYMFDYSLWGMNPAGYLITNILLHTLNGILFYWLLFKLSGRQTWGIVAAFIFLFHPVQVESVAWISQRKNVLAMFFFLTSILGYVTYRQDRTFRHSQWYILSCIMYLLALLSKSVVVIAPLVLLLFDQCFMEREARKGWLLNKLPYVLLTVAMVVVTLKSQSSIITSGEELFTTSSPLGMFYTMLTVLARYFALLFWPTHLSALYMVPIKFRIDSAVVWSALLSLFLITFGVFLFRRRRDLFFWYALIFIALIPVSQIVKIVTLMNDRYLYFPMLGAAAFFAGVLHPFISAQKPGGRRFIAVGALCLILLPLPWLSVQRVAVWHNDLTMWTDVVRKTPESTLAWVALGLSNYDAGKKEDALSAYTQALSIDPNHQLALNNIGGLYNEMGNPKKGRPFLTRVTQLFPDYFEGYINLGRNYFMTGDLENAEATFKKALALRPGMPLVLASLGDIYSKMNKLNLAEEYYRQAITNGGPNPDIENKLSHLHSR